MTHPRAGQPSEAGGLTVRAVRRGQVFKALVSDSATITACGVVNRVWWCEPRPGWLKYCATARTRPTRRTGRLPSSS